MPLSRTRLCGALALVLLAAPAAAQYHRVTTALGGQQPNGTHGDAVISGDGRFVAFWSQANNLVAGDGNASADVFVRDLAGAVTSRVSIGTDGLERTGPSGQMFGTGWSVRGSQIDISDDGRFVVFASRAGLAADDTMTCVVGTEPAANCPDIYLRDRQSNQTIRLSVGAGGVSGNGPSTYPRVSGDGRYVVFQSAASNLVAGDTNGVTDIFLVDRQAGALTRVNTSSSGVQADLPSQGPSLSDDGNVIAWSSASTTLSAEPDPVACERAPPACLRPFFTDRTLGATRRIPMPPTETRVGNPPLVVYRVEAFAGDVARDGRSIALNVSRDTGVRTNGTGVFTDGYIYARGAEVLQWEAGDSVSWDGRHYTYANISEGAVPSGTLGLRDRLLDFTTIVTGFSIQNEAGIFNASLGGLAVAFATREAKTVDDIDGARDIYVLNRDPDNDGLPSEYETFFGLDPTSGADGAADPDGDGVTSAAEYLAGTHPTATTTRYLAEGAANDFFFTLLAIANPGSTEARVLLRFQGDNGLTWPTLLTVPARQVGYHFLNGSMNPAASFSTVIESSQLVAVDRLMTWGNGYGSHLETAIEAPSTTWFLAEGATHGAFELFYLLQNPGTSPAHVTVRYFRPAPAPPVVRSYDIAPASRRTVVVDGIPELAATDVSASVVSDVPILVERSMYMNVASPPQPFGAGHAGAGVTAARPRWFLAEGATGNFFDLYYLVANPSTQSTHVRVTYLLPAGTPIVKEYTVAAESRLTISVEGEDARLANTPVSAIVESLDGVGIVVERSMWWPGGGQWQEGHLSAGSTVAGRRWALAWGEVLGYRTAETYVLIANTSPTAGTATISLLSNGSVGAPPSLTVALPPNSRVSVPMSQYPGMPLDDFNYASFGVLVESDGPDIVVERAVYANNGDVLWAEGADALATLLP